MAPDEYIQKLINLSEKKLTAIREILRLTEEQCAVITEDNLEDLQKIIDLKQKQMDITDENDAAFDIYFTRLKSVLGVESMEDVKMSKLNGAAELKQIITSIYEIIKQIQLIEKQNFDKANKLLEHLGQEIKKVNQGKIANNGYNIGGKPPPQSYYFDKKK